MRVRDLPPAWQVVRWSKVALIMYDVKKGGSGSGSLGVMNLELWLVSVQGSYSMVRSSTTIKSKWDWIQALRV